MKVTLDPEVNALYLCVREGETAETVELDEGGLIYLDMDAEGHPLGIEFINADDFLPFLRRRGGTFELADHIPARDVERARALTR
ncbi:MAG TPA: DUF2283 domain-containing protein [Thermomicrobiales bacterium]|nr:DUF2283 domain-containing protein [Thermomicrobiales bacterium]